MSSFDHAELERAIEAAWEAREEVTPQTGGAARAAIETTLEALDKGALRVAERQADGVWRVNQWAEEGGAAGLPAAGHGAAVGRTAGRRLVGQGATRSSRAGPSTTGAPPGFRAVPSGGGAALGLHRARAWC